VYEKIWSKIDGQLPNNVKKVIMSPDGIYNSINVSTLFDIENNKYIFDKYEIVIADKIGAENNAKLSQLTSSINSAVLVGFPNYSGTTISDKQNTNDTLKINLDKYYSNVTRGSIAKSLPGTKSEIEKINLLFANNGIKTTVLIENNATEDNLKNAVSPDVLHIATHGFFINSKEATPMLNSGLLLAGSNSKTKKIEDGYLSAYETSLLNLENTKLVVLSACETGRGVMKDGDGVFGLKQGCLNAGAQNIIMSLWKVDDKVTQEFMSRFYEIWLNDKISIREAFNKTQLEIKAKYPQPYYWGAFILVGE
jgi:CHAT domain-containing protein